MANLRDRLRIIKEQKKNETYKNGNGEEDAGTSIGYRALASQGWISCGIKALKREIMADSPFNAKAALPASVPIVIHDLEAKKTPDCCDFVFFDLETTGLSGGAGTLAFLAAFGRMIKDDPVCKLRITQYLLLDYPGESGFLDVILGEFTKDCIIVTYNGKCFDSQILKTRCLMNRIKPPEYHHADLLFPARRLWKNIIQDCSQQSVEMKILGLYRIGDIPGHMAPDIWFDFLKTGRTERLAGICDHNSADIKGLAAILGAMITIAEDPFDPKYCYDAGRLALYWRFFCRRHENGGLREKGGKLLRFAASNDVNCPPNVKAAVFRALAIDSERNDKDYALAAEYANMGLLLEGTSEKSRGEFERRKERLEKKLGSLN